MVNFPFLDGAFHALPVAMCPVLKYIRFVGVSSHVTVLNVRH